MAKWDWEKHHTKPELTLEPITMNLDWLDDEEALVECSICTECGDPFVPKHVGQTTCSRTCQLGNPECF